MRFATGSGTSSLTSFGGTDAFVAQFSGTGTQLWAQAYGGAGNDTAAAIALDSTGNISVTGNYVGPSVFGTATLLNLGTMSIFVMRLQNSSAPVAQPATTGWGLGAADILSNATIVDSSGNAYVTGGFSGTVNFSPGIGVTNLTSAGGRDAFLAKYSSTGTLLWARDFGGIGTDIATAIAQDTSGNIYLAGSYQNSVTFGTTTLTSVGSSDSFVAKLDSSGNVLWAQSGGGTGFDQATAIAVDASGNVVASGQFQGTATFGTTALTSAGSYDAFVVKYSATGTAQWARGFGGASADTAAGLAIDSSGNTYVVGRFAGTATFGSTSLTSAGGYDAYLVKFDPTGAVTWVHSYGGTGTDQATAVALDGSGNAYITGSFSNSVTFGSTTLTSAGLGDVFVTKVSTAGSVVWATGFGSTSSDTGNAITVDSSGTITVAGQYQGTMSFTAGSGTLSLASFGGTDAFVAQFSATGTQLWAQGYGGAGNDTATGVVIDSSGSIIVTGDYIGPAMFNTLQLGNLGITDIFFIRTKKPK
jgi:hypothetical protein